MAVGKSKLFKGIAWFVAVVVVLSLFLIFAQMMSQKNEFLKNQSLNMVLCLVSVYIAYDLFKKYKEERKKKLLLAVAFFVLIVVAFLAYFGSKFLT